MIAVIVGVCFTGGVIAGMIAYSKNSTTSTFVAFFVFGAVLPLIGIVAAALIKAPPKPAGWYADPWQQAPLRWHDGRDWTAYTSHPAEHLAT